MSIIPLLRSNGPTQRVIPDGRVRVLLQNAQYLILQPLWDKNDLLILFDFISFLARYGKQHFLAGYWHGMCNIKL